MVSTSSSLTTALTVFPFLPLDHSITILHFLDVWSKSKEKNRNNCSIEKDNEDRGLWWYPERKIDSPATIIQKSGNQYSVGPTLGEHQLLWVPINIAEWHICESNTWQAPVITQKLMLFPWPNFDLMRLRS